MPWGTVGPLERERRAISDPGAPQAPTCSHTRTCKRTGLTPALAAPVASAHVTAPRPASRVRPDLRPIVGRSRVTGAGPGRGGRLEGGWREGGREGASAPPPPTPPRAQPPPPPPLPPLLPPKSEQSRAAAAPLAASSSPAPPRPRRSRPAAGCRRPAAELSEAEGGGAGGGGGGAGGRRPRGRGTGPSASAMSCSIGQPDGSGITGGGGLGAAAGGDPSPGSPPPPAPEAAEEAAPAPRPPPEPDDAAAALRLALNQLSVLGLGGAGDQDEEGAAAGGGDGAAAARGVDGGATAEPTPPDGTEVGAPVVAVAPGPLPLLEPNVSPPPPPPRPSPPDVFAGFAPHPAALGPPTLLAEQMSVIGSRKKSVNMTECVPVPSSEHVAEIVGRQGEWPPSGAQPQGSLRCCSGDGAVPVQPHGCTPDPGHAPRGLRPQWRTVSAPLSCLQPQEKVGRSPRSGPAAAFVWASPFRKVPCVQRLCPGPGLCRPGDQGPSWVVGTPHPE